MTSPAGYRDRPAGIVRLATGATVQATIANTGGVGDWTQGTPVLAHVPADALRVLASPPVDANGAGELAGSTA